MKLYSAATLGDQSASTLLYYPDHFHYPDIEPTSPCLILIMPSTTWPESNKCQFLSHWFASTRRYPKMGEKCSTQSAILSGQMPTTCLPEHPPQQASCSSAQRHPHTVSPTAGFRMCHFRSVQPQLFPTGSGFHCTPSCH